jgi:hypothetical protein
LRHNKFVILDNTSIGKIYIDIKYELYLLQLNISNKKNTHNMDIGKLKQKIEQYGKPLSTYIPGKRIQVSDKMQKNYSYTLTARYGKDFHEDFKPEFTPQKMLIMGVFEGKYLNDCYKEFPKEWFHKAIKAKKLSPSKPDHTLNNFNIKSRLSLKEWERKDWTIGNDVRGWFQWYCRYYIGRRIPDVDVIQIKRWKSFKRHLGQIKANCKPKDIMCRPRQRQALLQWAYNPFI